MSDMVLLAVYLLLQALVNGSLVAVQVTEGIHELRIVLFSRLVHITLLAAPATNLAGCGRETDNRSLNVRRQLPCHPRALLACWVVDAGRHLPLLHVRAAAEC